MITGYIETPYLYNIENYMTQKLILRNNGSTKRKYIKYRRKHNGCYVIFSLVVLRHTILNNNEKLMEYFTAACPQSRTFFSDVTP